MSANPFLDPSFHIRWSALLPERVGPAIEAALGQAKAAVDAIAARDHGAVSYANTFLALEHATEELNMAWAKVTHLQSVADAPALVIYGDTIAEGDLTRAFQAEADGVIGPQTLASAYAQDMRALKLGLLAQRLRFMTDLPTWPSFGRGWARRTADLMET